MVKHLCAAGFASTKRLTFVICLALVCSELSQAAVIYDNGPVDLAQLSRFSDEVPDGSFPATRVADNFVLQTGASVIGHVQWWGTYSPNTPLPLDNFFIRIYTNAGGLPGALHTQVSVAPSRVDSGINQGPSQNSLDVYAYDADLPTDISLIPGLTYWLSIVNNVANSTWGWAHDLVSGNTAACCTPFVIVPFPERYAFRLASPGTIPEPATLVLVGIALAGLGFRRHNRIAHSSRH